MKFKFDLIDLGTIRERTSHVMVFESLEDLPKGIIVEPTCGCSQPKIVDGNKIRVSYNAGSVPIHLQVQGHYETLKSIRIFDANRNLIHTLQFKAKITV